MLIVRLAKPVIVDCLCPSEGMLLRLLIEAIHAEEKVKLARSPDCARETCSAHDFSGPDQSIPSTAVESQIFVQMSFSTLPHARQHTARPETVLINSLPAAGRSLSQVGGCSNDILIGSASIGNEVRHIMNSTLAAIHLLATVQVAGPPHGARCRTTMVMILVLHCSK